MKRWLLPTLLVFMLIAVALTVRLWLPPLLGFVGANSDVIQGFEALLQILFWVAAGAAAVSGLVRARRSADRGRDRVASVRTGGGAHIGGDVNTGGGKFVGRDDTSIALPGGVLVAEGASVGTIVISAALASTGQHLLEEIGPETDLDAATDAYLQYLLDRHRYLSFRGMGPSDRVALRLELLELYVPLQAHGELPEGETWARDLRLAGRELPDEVQKRGLGEPQPVLDLLGENAGLIVLGDPGAGKTTFLKFLALMSALGQGEALGFGQRLPLLVPLSAYANALGERDALRLDAFIADYLHETGIDLPLDALVRAALKAGKALILLDGLDEVKDPALRRTVVDRVVDFFTFHQRAGNKFVISNRIVGYKSVRPAAEGLVECTLVDFDDGEVEAFVQKWTAAIEKQAQGESAVAQADAERERRELLDAIRGNASVRRLAANPLLLTILALMKRQDVTLPERRVELYDQYIRTLLSSWNRARGLGRAPTRDLDPVQTVRVLAPLALWMHTANPGLGLARREDLRRELERIYAEQGDADPEASARQLLVDVREHAGLLLERGPGEYGFIHLTFEEYLAAVGVALAGQGDAQQIAAELSAHVDEAAWHEVVLLTVGYVGIIQQLDHVAGEVVDVLLEQSTGEPGQAVVLAGQAVLDALPGGVPARSRARVVNALLPAMQSADVAPRLRREAGLALGRLGWLPDDLDEFVEVPTGDFLYGDEKETRKIPYRYWIGKYLVTNAQFVRFVEDNGYERQELWSEEGWKWRKDYARTKPVNWNNPDMGNPIFPVMNVSWYETEAYCNWLSSQSLSIEVPNGYRVRLPNELEWERAARGTDGREYPWGKSFDVSKANTEDSDEKKYVSGTNAVCTYPDGKSPAGAWDMSGNVWEWTDSWWDEEKELRVLRGGSWVGIRGSARCAFRPGDTPVYFFNHLGFRRVVSLASSES